MKTIFYLVSLLVLSSCTTANKIDGGDWSGTISDTDERNAIMNSFADAYENMDAESAITIFSDDAVFYVNDTKMTPKEVVSAFMTGHEYYDDIKNTDRNTTTMFYNNGSIYTNYWYTWNGINKKTGELVVLRGYAWFKWDGMKVVEAYNAFDPTAYMTAFE
jgi:hypothetical protein